MTSYAKVRVVADEIVEKTERATILSNTLFICQQDVVVQRYANYVLPQCEFNGMRSSSDCSLYYLLNRWAGLDKTLR